jgi:ATP-binding protein involved in chromosome partitioning
VDQTAVPERIQVIEGLEVVITWEDGYESTLTAPQLRGACQCAECREEPGRRRTEAVLTGSKPVTITEAKLVGSYAINFVFGPDGHSTGIFPFPALRSLVASEDE